MVHPRLRSPVLVLDAELTKLGIYNYVKLWSQTAQGQIYLRSNTRQPVLVDGHAGPPSMNRKARGICRTHWDKAFGGEVWFKVLIQMDECPAEFVDAYNDAIDSRFRDSSFVDLMSGLCIAQTPRALPRSHCSRFGARCAPKWSTQFALRRAKRAEMAHDVTMYTHPRAKRARSGHNC